MTIAGVGIVEPVETGMAGADGRRVAYSVYGEGETTILFLPTWTIFPARLWKMQVPTLARHFRVVTYDGLGNGDSDVSTDPADHSDEALATHALAVLDATDTAAAIVSSLSCGAMPATRLAAEHGERVTGLIYLSPAVPLAPSLPARACQRFHDHIDDPVGFEKYNAEHWRTDFEDFVDFFVRRIASEPHSTRQHDEMRSWAMGTTPDILIAAHLGLGGFDEPVMRRLAARIDHPALVIHGDEDEIRSVEEGRSLAELLGAELVVVEGGSHDPPTRQPVLVNRAIRSFVDRISGTPAPRPRTWTRSLRRRPRALYLSSPIGLGHARRDVAIAAELSTRHPDLEIDWLAQHPVTAVLEAEGAHVHEASRWLTSESAHVAAAADGHDLHAFEALRSMDETLLANFMIFQEVVDDGSYDLVICDEAWDVDHFWFENPELKRAGLVWMTDFVGFVPMPGSGEHEAFLTADYNAEMLEHVERYPTMRDRAIFVGNPDDVVPLSFGSLLPDIRDWTEQHFDFSGYVTGFIPPTADEVAEQRHRLGYRDDELVCIAAVGGSGVGRALLELVIDAFPDAKRSVPELRLIAVAGPRIDPESLPRHEGVDVVGYVDCLHQHLSVCDLAVVQGGLTSTMELAAAKRPFLYFPLRNHFEQHHHVCHRLDRYGAGTRMDFDATTPERLAVEMVRSLRAPVAWRDVETDGAARAADLIAELL